MADPTAQECLPVAFLVCWILEGSMYDLKDLFSRISKKLSLCPRLSLADLSIEMRVERHTIEKAVKAGCGATFRDLRKRTMLLATQRMLREHPHLTLKEVAYALQYSSVSSFCRFIKTATGCSPRELRDQIAAEILPAKDMQRHPIFTTILKSGAD
jgi:AraC-like DNA-binding protein